MALDGLRWAFDGRRFDHVGIESSLHQPGDGGAGLLVLEDVDCLLIEYLDKFAADDLALLFRIEHSCQPGEKAVARVHSDQPQTELVAHVLLHLREFVLAQDTIIHKNTGEAVADGALHQHRGNRGIDPSGKSTDGSALSYLFADRGHRRLNELGGGPVGLGMADTKEEVAQQLGSSRGVPNLRVELHRPQITRRIGYTGD